MQRIKDVSKIKMNEGNVLIKIHKKESKIILPDSDGDENPSVDYAEVVALGKKVEGLEVGNIILEFKTVYGFEWESSHYAIVHRLSIGMAVDKDNFDLSRKKPTSKIKI